VVDYITLRPTASNHNSEWRSLLIVGYLPDEETTQHFIFLQIDTAQ